MAGTPPTALDDAVSVVSVAQSTIEIEVLQRGPKGDQGDPGPMGPQGPSKNTHTQLFPQPLMMWFVTHNLGFYPSVAVIDSSLTAIGASIVHVDLNTLTVSFGGPESGSVYCS